MPLSWNEIRHNAIRFSKEWAQIVADRRQDLQGVDHAAERALAQSFWLDFFGAFGIRKEVVRSFEVPVKMLSGSWGYIDLFWKRTLLVEHKSPGKNLAKAGQQANDYIQALVSSGRQDEAPRYVIVSDFLNLVLEDRRTDTRLEIPLAALHKHIQSFAFLIPSLKQVTYEEQDPINIEAAEVLGKLHDALKDGGYAGHDLEQFLVRILFCLFAEDTGIFDLQRFQLYIQNHTREDGSDLGMRLGQLFEVLNTPETRRQKNLPEELVAFPYVNGELFAEPLKFAAFNRAMRETLIACCERDWSLISPAIFGSLFQSIMQPKERRQVGAHYTSERDILKVVRSLFLDDLRAEFDQRKTDRSTGRKTRLEDFHKKLAALRFFDPACGCGNFLIITYRELRLLELEVLSLLHTGGEQELNVRDLAQVDVHQFYGIEIEEWPAKIAEVALWLMDHQMNIQLSKAFGGWYPRIPLKKSPHIICGNALRLDWKTVLPPGQCSFVLGNPPFVGKSMMNGEQGQDMELVWSETERAGVLDYVTAWYRKAAEYIQGTHITVGFVSTNSISQGEQVGALWNPLFQRFGLKIHFAHRTFAWQSEARGKAHVHVVIIGFGAFDTLNKRIYDYEGRAGSPLPAANLESGTKRRARSDAPYQPETVSIVSAQNISPYLVEGSDTVVSPRSETICKAPDLVFGSKATDGGNLILNQEERDALLADCSEAKRFIRPYISAEDFLHNIPRYCLWLVDANPSEWRNIVPIVKRVEAVKEFRLASLKKKTREDARQPSVFAELRQPKKKFLAIPKTSSERRNYIPIAFQSANVVVASEIYFCEGAELFHFGILSSTMHMAWVKQVCGRMKSDYRYSNKLVYNNYPWPENATAKQRAAVEEKAAVVLAVRTEFMVGTARCAVPARASQLSAGGSEIPLANTGKAPAGTSQLDVPTKACTLADLYDPLAIPPALVKAHAELDKAVDSCYRPEKFESDRQRVEFLFALYEKITAPLIAAAKPRRGRKASSVYAQKPPPLPQGQSTPESEAAAAHFWAMKEEPAQQEK